MKHRVLHGYFAAKTAVKRAASRCGNRHDEGAQPVPLDQWKVRIGQSIQVFYGPALHDRLAPPAFNDIDDNIFRLPHHNLSGDL